MEIQSDTEMLSDLLGTLELILDQAYLGLVFVDTKGVIRFMNKQYEDLIGVPREETYGKHITEYFPDSRLPLVIETRKPEWGWKYDYRGRGTLVVNRIPIIKDDRLIGALTQCIFRDISELKDMAKNLDLLQQRVRSYQTQLSDLLTPKYTFSDILGVSHSLNHAKEMARLYAGTESAVLITGETGTGKELFAHSIHNSSDRKDGPFVCLNCASIPSELLESLNLSRYVFFVCILILYLFLGMVMNIIPMIMVTLPIIYPSILALGFDPIWFGVVMVIMMEMGQISPPVGINVFVIHSTVKDISMGTIFKGVVPFILMQVITILILTLFPALVLFLPELMDVLPSISN